MANVTGSDYLDVPNLIADVIRALPTPRTGAPLASIQGDELTIITHRLAYIETIYERLPALVIDLDDSRPARHSYQGNVHLRAVPISIAVLTPLYAYLDGLSQQDVETYVQTADQDIKQLIGDLEEVLNSQQARKIGHNLEVNYSHIAYDELALQSQAHVRARVGEVALTTWIPIRGF